MKIILTFFFCSFLYVSAISQNHDYYWPMGFTTPFSDSTFGRTVIDFKEDPPLIYQEDRDLNIRSTMASFCDSLGNLQFYTNGIQLIGSNHQLVEGGDSLNTGYYASLDYSGGYKVPESIFFLPMPGHPDTLLLLHGSTDIDDVFAVAIKTFHQTKIYNGQEKYVVEKNRPILENVKLSGFAAVKHANGRDWWVLWGVQSENRYFRFLVTDKGIGLPDEIELSPQIPLLWADVFLSFVQDGNKMVRYYVSDGIYIYDFDRCDGVFSNGKYIPVDEDFIGWGHVVSPNSRYLYVSSTTEILQYDLWADDIEQTRETVAVFDGYQSPFSTNFHRMQNGPDGRIYAISNNVVNVLHSIQYPNKKGLPCDVRQHSVHLPTYNGRTMPHHPNYCLGPLDGSPCDTLGLDNVPVAKYRYEQDTTDYLQVEFTDLSYYEPAEWHWDFGDNATSKDTSPVHTFSQDGTYEVCLTVSKQYGEHTFCRTLELGTVSSVEEVEKVDITVFPNPCRDGVNVLIGNYLPRDAKVVLYDAVGQRQKVQSVQTGWNTMHLNGLNPGIYFYEIWESEVLIDSGKLLKVE